MMIYTVITFFSLQNTNGGNPPANPPTMILGCGPYIAQKPLNCSSIPTALTGDTVIFKLPWLDAYPVAS